MQRHNRKAYSMVVLLMIALCAGSALALSVFSVLRNPPDAGLTIKVRIGTASFECSYANYSLHTTANADIGPIRDGFSACVVGGGDVSKIQRGAIGATGVDSELRRHTCCWCLNRRY